MTSAWVDVKNLCYRRGKRIIFEGANLTIEQGKITAIMGPSGTGKTTLLKLIGAMLTPDSGTITVAGQDIHALDRDELYLARRKMGMLFQTSALFTNIDVFDNVAFPMRENTDLSEELIRNIVLMKLEAVGLRGAAHLMPGELSGGMARRVALARAMALDPQLMMYDEPFVGQDPISMGVLVKLIKTLNDVLGLTSIVVSHDIHETFDVADYIYILSEGRVVGEGTPEDMNKNDSPHVKQFVHGLPDGVVPFHYPAVPLQEDLITHG